jgi:hypothetical protein
MKLLSPNFVSIYALIVNVSVTRSFATDSGPLHSINAIHAVRFLRATREARNPEMRAQALAGLDLEEHMHIRVA